MDWFNRVDKLITWILILLLIAAGGMFWWNSHLNSELEKAKAESELAQSELLRIKGVSEFRKVELDRIQAEADRAISEADAKIAKLNDQATIRKSLIDQLKAENERLNSAILATINLPVEDPLPPDELLKEAEQLYFPRDFGTVELSGNPGGLELLQVMLREIQQRRELDFTDSRLITEQGKQIATLGQVISEQEIKLSGLQSKFNAQSGLVTSLENEIIQYDQVIKTKDKQIGILEKQNKTGIRHYLINAGIAIAAFEAGRRIE